MGTIIFKVMEMSIAALLLIVAVVLIRIPLRKAPKWFMGILWAIVALRLIVPVQVTAHVGFMPDFGDIVTACFDGEKEAQDGPVSVSSGIYESVGYTKSLADEATETTAEVVPARENVTEDVTDSQKSVGVPVYLQVIWVIGFVGILGYAVISYLSIKKKTAASIKYFSGDNVYVCDDIETPFVFGVFKPSIYMPSGLDCRTIKNVIAHEKTHIKRLDHLRKQFGFLVLAIHWFNPLVWLAYALFCRDIELACDERVVSRMNLSQKRSYANSLLSCSTQRRMVLAYPLAFGEVGVVTRVKQIFNYKKPTAWLVTALVIICGVLSTCSFTKAADKKVQQIAPIPLVELKDVEVKVSEDNVNADVTTSVVVGTEAVKVSGSIFDQENQIEVEASTNGATNLPYNSDIQRNAANVPNSNGDNSIVEVKDNNEEVKVQVSEQSVNVSVKDGNENVNVNTSNPVMEKGETVGDVINELNKMVSEDEELNKIVNEAIDEAVDEIYDEVFDEIYDEGLGGLFKLFP